MEEIKPCDLFFSCLCTIDGISLYLQPQRCKRKVEEITQSEGNFYFISPEQVFLHPLSWGQLYNLQFPSLSVRELMIG